MGNLLNTSGVMMRGETVSSDSIRPVIDVEEVSGGWFGETAMMHAPASEAKNAEAATRSQARPMPLGETHPHAMTAPPQLVGAGRGASPRSDLGHRQTLSRAQSAYGNQAVLRMLKPASNSTGALQRKCACNGAGANCGACKEKAQVSLQRRAGNQAEPNEVRPIVQEVLRSGGQPLSADVRSFMEPRFGRDFSQVRVHTDEEAAESAREMNALAYTVGDDVVFGLGQYAPHTDFGKRLIAHELTHVVQQRGRSIGRIAYRQVGDETATGGQRLSATVKLLNVIADMEKVHSFGSEKLASMTFEELSPEDSAQGRTDDESREGAQAMLDTVAENIGRMRAVAEGDDESLKLSVLSAFTPQRMAQADTQLGVVPRVGNAPQGSTAPEVQESRPEGVAAMSMQVSAPHDAAEMEADRIAAAIISGDSVQIGQAASSRVVHRQVGEALVAAGTGLLVADAELAPVEAATGPPGWAVAAGLAVAGVALLAIGYALTRTRVCPPCPAPPNPDIHRVPPSEPHFPCPGDHWHYFRYNQNPQTCQCFLQRLFGGCCGHPGAPC